MNPIQHKIWNINLVVEEIRQSPQTYETILKSESKNGTLLTILRRKLSRLVKDGVLCKTVIPATRYSRVIYYIIPKKYYILFETSRFGCNVYFFYEYKKCQKFYIEAEVYYKLEHNVWQEKYKKTFFEGNILKMI
jgi:hypothetical protein